MLKLVASQRDEEVARLQGQLSVQAITVREVLTIHAGLSACAQIVACDVNLLCLF